MAITDVKNEIKAFRPSWKIIRDFKSGEKAVKDAGKEYLPAINSEMESNADYYKSYQERGEVKPFTKKGIETNVGMILSKDPIVPDFPEVMKPIISDISNSGINLSEFISELTDEVCTTQFCGVLIDHSESPGAEISVAQKRNMNLRSFAVLYPAESIVNFGTKSDGNLRFVVLAEDYQVFSEEDVDMLYNQTALQYRLLIIRDNIYYNEVYRFDDKDKEFLYSQHTPYMNGKLFDFIPFVFVNGLSNIPKIEHPRMLSIAVANKHDYQDHVDYKWLLHYCAVPTAYVTGTTEKDDFRKIGPGVVWKISTPEAKVGVLEISGNAFPAMENNLKSNTEKIAGMILDSLGLQKSNETATRERYEMIGKTVALKQIAKSIETAINQVLEWLFLWENQKWNDKYCIKFHTDFVQVNLDAQEIQALVSAYIQGAISLQDLFYNFQKGGKIDSEKTFEEHQNEILSQGGDITVGEND